VWECNITEYATRSTYCVLRVPFFDSGMTYSEAYFTTRETWRDWRIEARQLIDLARVTRGARVLEIGCGGGGLLRMLRERGACAVGVDTLERALILAQHREGESGREGEAATFPHSPALPRPPSSFVQITEDGRLPFRDAAFDAIIAQHVVEHLPDVVAALREWKRVLKPRGRIALATPNAHYPDPAHFADADHARVFAPAELRDIVERAGFAVESCYTLFPFLSRTRVLRACGVIAHCIFQHIPHFAMRGRTILLSALRPAT